MGVAAGLHRAWLGLIKLVCRLRGASHVDAIYNDRYFSAEEEWTDPTASKVVDGILAAFPVKSVADVGCGTAVYLKHFLDRGVKVQGYEGSAAAIQRARIPQQSIQSCDLTKPLATSDRFDLAICFEVAEHLPDAFADTLAASIASLAPLILFSAAQPGQGGVDHVNEQPPAYWVGKFERLGLRHDEALSQKLRADLKARGTVWWLETNLVVLRRP